MRDGIKSCAQNAAILLLVALTVFQTGQLWLGASSSHDFFNLFESLLTRGSENEEQGVGFASPYRLVFGAPGGELKLKYGDIANDEGKEYGDRIIAEFLKSGEFVARGVSDLRKITNGWFVVYDYAFAMPAQLFARCYGQRGAAFVSQVEAFDRLVIAPSETGGETRLFFIDSGEDLTYEFKANADGGAAGGLVSAISAARGIRCALFSGGLFVTDAFVPIIEGGFSFKPVYVVNPYAQGGRAAIYTVEKEIDLFFANPIAKSAVTAADVFMFSDSSVVVKYYSNHILEYQNFKTETARGDSGVIADYAAAAAFIAKDTNVVNDFYLAGYAEDGFKRSFYFDYAVDGFRLIIPDAMRIKSELGTDRAIEITVEAGRVVYYKKIAYSFWPDAELMEEADRGFASMFDEAFGSYFMYDADPGVVQDIELGYKLANSSQLYLNWFMRINDVNYVSPAQARPN